MADFTTITLEANVGNVGTPNWQNVLGAGREIRWSDVNSAGVTTASASWPFMTRPAATAGVDYAYAYTADAVGHGVYGGGASSAPAAFATSQYLQFRWSWDNLGTFASAPIFTAYPSTAHANPTRGDGSLLGGHVTDTGATARSYLKGASYGSGATTQVPGAGPAGAPAVTDGATGAVYASLGAWSAWQALGGDLDYLVYGATPGVIPTAVTAQVAYIMLRLFTGPNMSAGTHVPVVSMKYTYT